MKYLVEFRDPEVIGRLKEKIEKVSPDRTVKIMEVCGTHTMAIRRFGLPSLLPPTVRLISGPGCPVCVTPNRYIDTAIALSRLKGVTIATFGDMVKVPGSSSSLEREKSKGARVLVVYSPHDVLLHAEKNPEEKVVFLAVGFETTAPLIAAALKEARDKGIRNFYVLPGNKVIPPAMEALLQDPEIEIDAFLLPGHVSAIIGTEPYRPLVEKYGITSAVGGFEPADILSALYMILSDLKEGKSEVRNAYTRVVKREGNPRARKIMREVFAEADSEWRGLGMIPSSGLELKDEYKEFDIRNSAEVDVEETRENPLCRCGDVLKGKVSPPECPLFGKSCTPDNPYGPCMVSSEGTCAAYYKYGG